jgi:hypothetical protein
MNNETVVVIFCVIAGLFSLISSIVNWSWFFNNRRAQAMVKIFGYKGARIFYGILGVILLLIGLFILSAQ